MAVQIFKLRGVPDDEAEDIRQLLATHHIDYYESPAGRWGMSMPALWIKNDYQRERALSLIAEYQQQRALRARQHYEQLKSQGLQLKVWDMAKSNPLRFILSFLAIAGILYISIVPFLKMAGW